MNLAWIERLQAVSRQLIELEAALAISRSDPHSPVARRAVRRVPALGPKPAHPDLFVAVAGYGDCAPGYICTDGAYTDRGGYEQTWSFVDPSEQFLKLAMAGLISGAPTG